MSPVIRILFHLSEQPKIQPVLIISEDVVRECPLNGVLRTGVLEKSDVPRLRVLQ